MDDQPLTKEQLEAMGFTVKEKKLKKSTKITITYGGCCSCYFDVFYHYPTFSEIVYSIVKNVREYDREIIKNDLINRLFN